MACVISSVLTCTSGAAKRGTAASSRRKMNRIVKVKAHHRAQLISYLTDVPISLYSIIVLGWSVVTVWNWGEFPTDFIQWVCYPGSCVLCDSNSDYSCKPFMITKLALNLRHSDHFGSFW